METRRVQGYQRKGKQPSNGILPLLFGQGVGKRDYRPGRQEMTKRKNDGSNWSSLLSPEKSDGSIAWSQRSSTLTLIFDNYLWVIGGYKGETSEKVLADVWKYGKP